MRTNSRPKWRPRPAWLLCRGSAWLGVAVVALSSGCGPHFAGSPVPLVQQSEQVAPLKEGVYDVHIHGDDSWSLVQTSLNLTVTNGRYRLDPLAYSRTIVRAGEAHGFDVRAILEGTEPLAGSTRTAEQASFLAERRGFVLGILTANTYIFQVPPTFDLQEWPQGPTEMGFEWLVARASLEGDAMVLSMVDAACQKASSALFGTYRTCNDEADCPEIVRVGKFVKSAEVNRGILKVADEEFSELFVPFFRLEKTR